MLFLVEVQMMEQHVVFSFTVKAVNFHAGKFEGYKKAHTQNTQRKKNQSKSHHTGMDAFKSDIILGVNEPRLSNIFVFLFSNFRLQVLRTVFLRL